MPDTGNDNKRLPPPLTAARLERAGLDYLARFAASAAQLRRVLMRRVRRSAQAHGTDPAELAAITEALIARWIAAGVLNDAGYAEAKAVSLHRRGMPKARIAAKLHEKGVDRDVIDQVLTQDPVLGDNRAAALALARRRRLGPYRLPELRAASYQKDLGILARAGFDRRTALIVLDAENPEAVPGAED